MGDEVLYPLLQPLLRPLLRMPNERADGQFIPSTAQLAALAFGAGEQGVLGAFDDFTKLFQDNPPTIPVTAVGQPVVTMLDVSGRGNNVIFANAMLATDGLGHYGLTFNGTTTKGVTASIDFTASDKLTVWTGFRKSSDAAIGVLMELSPSVPANTGAFSILAPSGAGSNNVEFSSKGTTNRPATATGLVAPATLVAAGVGDISAPLSAIKINGGAAVNNVSSQGTGNYGNYALNLGARNGASLFFNGILYAFCVRGAASSASLLAAGEAWANSKTGAY